MALTYYSNSNEPEIRDLAASLSDAEDRLVEIKIRQENIQKEYESKRVKSIGKALRSLEHLVNKVLKTDKALIYWVERGSSTKLLLRCIGINRKTKNVIAKTTEKVKQGVGPTELKFRKASEVVADEHKAVQSLDTMVTAFTSRFGGVQEKANACLREYDGKIETMQRNIDSKTLDSHSVQSRVSQTEQDAANAEQRRRAASQASNKAAGVSVASLKPVVIHSANHSIRAGRGWWLLCSAWYRSIDCCLPPSWTCVRVRSRRCIINSDGSRHRRYNRSLVSSILIIDINPLAILTNPQRVGERSATFKISAIRFGNGVAGPYESYRLVKIGITDAERQEERVSNCGLTP
jgi:hypothetical protein